MTILEINKMMLEQEPLVFIDEDLNEIKIQFNTPEEFIKQALEITRNNNTFYESNLDNLNIDYYNDCQCDNGRNRSIHDLYLIYRHYCKSSISFSAFNVAVNRFCENNSQKYIYFRCDDIGNLVVTNKYGGVNQPEQRDCFNNTMTDYIFFEDSL